MLTLARLIMDRNSILSLLCRFLMEKTKEDISTLIAELEKQLTGDMFKDMDLKDKIHNLKMKLNGTRPMNSEIECVGCGS